VVLWNVSPAQPGHSPWHACAERVAKMEENEAREGDVVAFMSRHFVALTCHYDLPGTVGAANRHVAVISGFLLEVRDFYFWVTAGHCLKELDKLLASEVVKVCGGGFMDFFGYDAVHKHSVPFRYERGSGFYVTRPEDGIDFGLIALNDLQIRAFKANKVIVISRENWVGQRDLTFDFYMMLGIPANRVIKTINDDGEVNAHIGPLMTRVDRLSVDDLGEVPSDAEAAPTDAWFIGQIPAECKTVDIKGMSGGPIYGFRRNENGRLIYHVVALQSRWWDKRRIVFGCSVPLFAEEVYQQLGEVMCDLGLGQMDNNRPSSPRR
jgi:hypothetical protein